jgi:hypothetical protein
MQRYVRKNIKISNTITNQDASTLLNHKILSLVLTKTKNYFAALR